MNCYHHFTIENELVYEKYSISLTITHYFNDLVA